MVHETPSPDLVENVIIVVIGCHVMCHVISFRNNFFATCLRQLDIIAITCGIYALKLVVNLIVNIQFFCNVQKVGS
jgi:hypothetical protein